MLERRTCRACGCWEMSACEGGCSWLSADRCSACPNAPLTLPVNPAHLRAAAFHRVDYADHGGGRLRATYRCIDYPNITMTWRSDLTPQWQAFVGALEVDAHNLATVADLLNSARKAA